MQIPRPTSSLAAGAALIMTLACSLAAPAPPTIAPDCHSEPGPSEGELRFILDFPGALFDSGDWARKFTVEPSRITATWTSEALGAVAYMDYLVYACGYSQQDLDSYFSEENFQDVFFSDYEEVVRTAMCSTDSDDIRLHEFTATFSDVPYDIRFWIMKYGEARIINATLAVPAGRDHDMARLSRGLFRALPDCVR